MKTASVIIGALILVVVISVGGYQLGWWLKAENTERQVKIDNTNTGTQTAWHDQATQDIKEFYLLDESNTAARGHLRQEACDYIARLSDPYLDSNLLEFQALECS